jgi:hypothetical protein
LRDRESFFSSESEIKLSYHKMQMQSKANKIFSGAKKTKVRIRGSVKTILNKTSKRVNDAMMPANIT